MQKTGNDYVEPKPQTLTEIEDETDEDKKGYLQTAIDFSKVDLTMAWENQEKKIEGILDAAANLPPKNVKIDDHPTISDIFIDEDELFNGTDLTTEKKTIYKIWYKELIFQRSEQ